MISQEVEREARQTCPAETWELDLAPHAHENLRRWKLLIAVIDCSHHPKLHNPPRTVRALKTRLASALGVEALSQDAGGAGLEAASAQAIFSGLDGPERHILEEDEQLCGFWDKVTRIDPGELDEHPVEVFRGSRRPSRQNIFLAVPAASNGHGSRGPSAGPTCSGSKTRGSFNGSLGLSLQHPQHLAPPILPIQPPSASGTPPNAAAVGPSPTAAATSPSSPTLSQGNWADTSALEQQVQNLEERCEQIETELANCRMELDDCQNEVDELREEISNAQASVAAKEEQLEQLRKTNEQLQEQNLGFIKTFEDQIEKAREEIRLQIDDKYQKILADQARRVSEAEGQTRRVEGQLRVTLDSVKDLEASLRKERANAQRSESALATEHARIADMQETLNSQAVRLRQMEYFAHSWRRKVAELSDSRIQALTDPETYLSFRIMGISQKLQTWPKGRMVQSPEFSVPGLGQVQFEFFPNGETNARQGHCSLRLRVPHQTRLRWRVRLGSHTFDTREDHYDQRQWWNRYGIQALNLFRREELLPEVQKDTDSVCLGVEIVDIMPIDTFEDDEEAIGSERVFDRSPSPSPVKMPIRNEGLADLRQKVDVTVAREFVQQRTQPLPAYALGAGTASAAAAHAAFVVKSGNLPPAVAAGRGLLRSRSIGTIRALKT